MAPAATRDLDFTAARLHGRRSRLADGAVLDELCRIRTVGELCRRLEVNCGPRVTASEFQRKILEDYASELTELASGVSREYADFFEWQRYRFRIENVKVICRGLFAKKSVREINTRLVGYELPKSFAAEEDFLENPLPLLERLEVEAAVRKTVADALPVLKDSPHVFTLETLIDCGYYAELVRRAALCGRSGDEEGVSILADQEAAGFMTMLALRGALNYGLKAETLSRFHVAGTRLSVQMFERLATVPLKDVAAVAGGVAFDALPPEPSVSDVEAACWSRYLRLANRLFRRGHMNVAAIAGFAGLRRIEVANLITISEGLRLGVDGHDLRARLIPRGK